MHGTVTKAKNVVLAKAVPPYTDLLIAKILGASSHSVDENCYVVLGT